MIKTCELAWLCEQKYLLTTKPLRFPENKLSVVEDYFQKLFENFFEVKDELGSYHCSIYSIFLVLYV
jgi:hypothetical protein